MKLIPLLFMSITAISALNTNSQGFLSNIKEQFTRSDYQEIDSCELTTRYRRNLDGLFNDGEYKNACQMTNEIELEKLNSLSVENEKVNSCIHDYMKNGKKVRLTITTEPDNIIPGKCKAKNRFDDIYTFEDAKIPGNTYLNGAVYGRLEVQNDVVKYNHDKTNGFFVVTNAPLVENGEKPQEVFNKATKENIKEELYVPGNKHDCKGKKDFASFSREGSKEATAKSYWTVVVKQNIKNAVMLTNFVETPKNKDPPKSFDCKIKADIYFPLNKGETKQFDDVKVFCKEFESYTSNDLGADKRTLEVTIGNTKAIVTHYHYRYWADFGVPDGDNLVKLKNLATKIADEKKKSKNCIAHCTGGVGRTGTFLAMVLGYEASGQFNKNTKLNLVKLILTLRSYRNYLVETSTQFGLLTKLYHDLGTKNT